MTNRFEKPERATETLKLRIEPTLKKDLQLLAENEGISVSEYVKFLIREEVDREFKQARKELQEAVDKRP